MENDKITTVEETTPTAPEAAVDAVPEKEAVAGAAASDKAACTPTTETPVSEAEAEAVPPAPSPDEVNAANAAHSTGKVTDDGQGASFFTAADVRAMSREQVRRNLAKILKSMESPDF